MYKVMAQQGQTINKVIAGNQQSLEAVKASGNARGQRQGAATVQIPQPQTQVNMGASSNGPFEAPRPRSFSEAVSGNQTARQTVRQSLEQQATTGAQITAMSDERWREAMNRAFGMTSASPTQEESRSRTQSLGTMDQPMNGVRFNLDN